MKATTGTTWFVVSSHDGALKPVRGVPPGAKLANVVERAIESAVALAPSLIGVEGGLPLLLHGGQDSPDQLYVDELGRLTVVEAKKVKAGRGAMVQLLAYGHQWAGAHQAVLGRLFAAMAERASLVAGADLLSVTRPDVAAWNANEVDKLSSLDAEVAAIEKRAGSPGIVKRLGDAVLGRLYGRHAAWVDQPASLLRTASTRWGEHALELHGAPPRLVLVAPEFTPDCVDLAESLQAHWIAVDLIRLQLHRDHLGRTFVVHERICGLPHAADAWRAMTSVWPALRGRYVPGRFYMYKKGSAVLSIVHRDQPEVEVSLLVDENQREGGVHLRLPPHGWFDGEPSGLRRVRKRFADALTDLPEHDGDGRDAVWSFRLPKERKEWLDTFVRASAIAHDLCGSGWRTG